MKMRSFTRHMPLLPALVALLGGSLHAAPSAYTYDLNNRVTQLSRPDGKQATFSYDETGNILSIITRTNAAPAILVTSPLHLTAGAVMADYSIILARPEVVKSYAVKNLPPGLKSNLTTKVNTDGKGPGVIYGTPTTAGAYGVVLTVTTTTGATQPVTLMMHVTNPFSLTEDKFQLTGAYSGALPATALSGGLGGSWSLKVTSTGSFTGTLTLGSAKHSFAGSFNGATGAAAAIVIKRKAPLPNLVLTLNLDLSTQSALRGRVTASLTDGATTDTLLANREAWSKTLPAAFFAAEKGSTYHTALVLKPAHAGLAAYPQGDGFARITVDRLGKAAVAGKLADGTPLTASAIFWPDGTLPLFISLHAGKGGLAGSLLLGTGFAEDNPLDNDVTGALDWTRPAAATGVVYKAGFATQVNATGGVYTAPAKGFRVLDLGSAVSHPAIAMQLASGGISATATTALTISTANVVSTFAPNNLSYKLTFTPATGLFSGEFTDAGRKGKVEGLVLPANALNTAEGRGFFLLPGAPATNPTLSGPVLIARP